MKKYTDEQFDSIREASLKKNKDGIPSFAYLDSQNHTNSSDLTPNGDKNSNIVYKKKD